MQTLSLGYCRKVGMRQYLKFSTLDLQRYYCTIPSLVCQYPGLCSPLELPACTQSLDDPKFGMPQIKFLHMMGSTCVQGWFVLLLQVWHIFWPALNLSTEPISFLWYRQQSTAIQVLDSNSSARAPSRPSASVISQPPLGPLCSVP